MVSFSKKIVIAFFPPSNKDWMGGVNYFCNLFHAMNVSATLDFMPIAFVGKKSSREVVKLYQECNVNVVFTSLLDRRSFISFFDRLSFKLFGKRFLLNCLMKKHSVDVVSHVQNDMGVSCKQIAWIPDFQHMHLPDMFTSHEIQSRNKSFEQVSKKANAIILSSYDALKDFKDFFPNCASKGFVAQFVSQPPNFYFQLDESDAIAIKEKYKIDRPFIYVPNQFWRHKNHALLLEAVHIAKQSNVEPLILCSGLMEDYRDSSYIKSLVEYHQKHGLDDCVRFLGSIPYKDVFSLIKFSQVVLNPSKFEGWSSVVEECKTTGKMMILSNIAVHVEQYPSATFFDVNSVESLACKIIELNNVKYTEVNNEDLHLALIERTKKYANTFSEICQKVLNDQSS